MEQDSDFFIGLKNLKIFYQYWIPDKPKAIIQILHGGFEHIGRYKNLIKKLTTEGFIVYGNDHRGHGRSEGKRSHIKSFEEYVTDCYSLTKIIKKKHPNLPIFILGHSMGSFIGQRYAIHYQDELSGMILSGSGTHIPLIPTFLQIIARIMSKIYPTFKAASNLNPDDLSTDPESIEDYTNDPLINYQKATAALGVAFMDHYKEIKSKIGEIHIPILIQKGDLDVMVLGIEELDSDLQTKDKIVKIYKGSKHEVYTETKEKRDEAFVDLVEWLDAHL
jgi:alpha-beta hydrolase superfamily lysophospholipase